MAAGAQVTTQHVDLDERAGAQHLADGQVVGHRHQRDAAFHGGARGLEHGAAAVEDHALARLQGRGGGEADGAFLARGEFRRSLRIGFEGAVVLLAEDRATMGAIEHALSLQSVQVAPQGGERGIQGLRELLQRDGAVALQEGDDPLAALHRQHAHAGQGNGSDHDRSR